MERPILNDEWTKNLDYLIELSAWEREMTGAIHVNDYERAFRAADRILAHISFLIVDFDPKTKKKLLMGRKTQKYLYINNLIAKGMREALASNNRNIKNRQEVMSQAYNTAREVETTLKETINECGLYFRFKPQPRNALATGLSGQ